MRTTSHLRIALAVAALSIAMLALPAVADAAKVRISGATVNVGQDGTAAVGLSNPNRSKAKGTLKLEYNGQSAGSKSFSIPARRSRTVSVPLTVGTFNALQQAGSLLVDAAAKARGKGTGRKSITLAYGETLTPPTNTPPTNTPTPPTGGGGGSSTPWQQGRWQGTWATDAVDLSFNITGNRLYTGPFDGFYITATCHNTDPEYTGYEQVYQRSTSIEPVEATISPDGKFSGSGTYVPSPNNPYNWTLTGQVSGGTLSGTFSVNYFYSGGSDPCSGTANFTARWYGDYTL